MEELIKYILTFGNLNKQQTDFIARKAIRLTVSKDTYFTESGKIPRQVAFVLNGVFRSLYYNKNGEEITSYFIDENQFVTEYKKFEASLPASEYLQAVTDCELLVFSKNDWDEISSTIAGWDKIVEKIFKKYLLEAIKKRSAVFSDDANSRYLSFIENFPTLINRVPHSYIASYIGITQQSLSRMRESNRG